MPKSRIFGLADAGKSDAQRVDEASAHLLTLFEDPYYYEAYQNLIKENHPKLHKIVGRTSRKKGQLAARYQYSSQSINDARIKMSKRGRPRTVVSSNYDFLIARCKELRIPLKEGCRRVVKEGLGSGYEDQELEGFYNIVTGYKRRKMAKRK